MGWDVGWNGAEAQCCEQRGNVRGENKKTMMRLHVRCVNTHMYHEIFSLGSRNCRVGLLIGCK